MKKTRPDGAYQLSPYAVLGDRDFETADGRTVTPVFRSDDATMLLVPARLAAVLRSDPINAGTVAPSELSALVDAGLVSDDVRRTRADHYSKMAAAVADPSTRHFTVLPTTYCNMGCEYCGQEHRKSEKSTRRLPAVVERIQAACADPEVRGISLAWFGGEPLLAYAHVRQMSRDIITAAQRHDTRYHASMVTNGVLLDERKLQVLTRECAVKEFTVTIDGPQRIHDVHRPLKSGQGSFDRVVGSLARAVNDGGYDDVLFIIRTNVDVQNCDYVDEYLDHMAAAGFAGHRNVMFNLNSVHPWGNDVEALRLAKRQYAERELGWFARMQDLDLSFQLLPSAIKPRTCAAVSRHSEILDSEGSVFSCSEHPLVPSEEERGVLIPLAGLFPGSLRPAGQFDDWAERVSEGAVQCSRCAILPVCGGNCPKAWADGDIACPSLKDNIKGRLALAARRKGLRPTNEGIHA